MQNSIDENGKKQTLSTPSTATKFFLENDDGLASPLSMTIAGSFALSAYNNSSPVYVIYRQVSDMMFLFSDARKLWIVAAVKILSWIKLGEPYYHITLRRR